MIQMVYFWHYGESALTANNSPRKPERDIPGTVIIILTIGVTIALIALSVTSEITHEHLSVEEGTLLSTILGAAIGAIATYIGSKAPPNSPQ